MHLLHSAGFYRRFRLDPFSLSIGVMVFIVLQVFGGHAILLFFDGSESQAFQIAVDGLHLFAFVFLINGLNVLIIAYFTALGEARISIIISAARGLVFVLLGVIVLPILLGIAGVWVAIPLAELLTLAVALMLIRMHSRMLNNKIRWTSSERGTQE